MARACGLSQAAISEIETGRANPTLGVLDTIAGVLDIPTCALFGAEEPIHALHDVLKPHEVSKVIGGLLEKGAANKGERWAISTFITRAAEQAFKG